MAVNQDVAGSIPALVVMKTERRYYDDKRRKRDIFVTISTWRGVSVGAKHYYAKLREADNPIWDGEYWIHNPKDPLLVGKSFGEFPDTAFNTFDAAVDWVLLVIKDEFPVKTHKLWSVSGSLITTEQLRKML